MKIRIKNAEASFSTDSPERQELLSRVAELYGVPEALISFGGVSGDEVEVIIALPSADYSDEQIDEVAGMADNLNAGQLSERLGVEVTSEIDVTVVKVGEFPPPPPSSPASAKSNVGAIVGGVIGGIVVLMLIVGGAWAFNQKRDRGNSLEKEGLAEEGSHLKLTGTSKI